MNEIPLDRFAVAEDLADAIAARLSWLADERRGSLLPHRGRLAYPCCGFFRFLPRRELASNATFAAVRSL